MAVRRLLAHPFSSLSNILVIALTLAIPIIGASILVSTQPVARQISVAPEITLFMTPGADSSAAANVASRISASAGADSGIRKVHVVSRAQALARLKSNPTWADALSALSGNPLPDAVVVTLDNGADSARLAATLTKEWSKWQDVDRIQLDSDWVQRLEALLQFARIGLWLLAIGVALVVLATVFNTVRMQALMLREEIGVARLVGATESFVRRPFLYLGGLTGIIASLLAVGLSALALIPLNSALAHLAKSYGMQIALHLPTGPNLVLSVVVVAILAALSARWSVTRNTRF